MITSRNCIFIIGFMALFTTFFCFGIASANTCDQWVARAVSVQGGVQVLKEGERQWRPVKLHDLFCPGDMVRVLKLGRADILMRNESALRLDQNTTVRFSQPEDEKSFLLNLLRGAAYFFSRVRRGLRVATPFVNATVEGTEFFVSVESDKTFLSVFEGTVEATNQTGRLLLTKGESAVAEAGKAPAVRIVARPRDAVQWTLYYPPILYSQPRDFDALSSEDWHSKVRSSIDFLAKGVLEKALEAVEDIKENVRDPRFFVYRASLLLSVGRVVEANSDIREALRLAPESSQALSLQSVIALVQNEKDLALRLAKQAVERDPCSASARIALSYALQAHFDLKGALGSLKEAVRLEPGNALAWARLAELWLSFGDLKEAVKAAFEAVRLSPNLARTQSVLGFAYLLQIRTEKSKGAFEKAIELDQADPLPRLGLGLTRIRDGQLEEGRQEIEIAASLSPTDALIRSYLGKAYYEEKREKPASSQFSMAKDLDPSDPTPFFYDAILKQSINRPVEALYDLEKSISLNDHRAVYRSRLLLDADLAARSASLARIYSDLGFSQRGLAEGWRSVNIDPANFSAHRFLADSYASLPRHEIARVSELLQSQLLQPININPIQPRLGESNLYILSGAGPADLSFNEFNPLFNRNRLALQLSGIGGEQSTLGEEIVQSGVQGGFSYSVGQFHFQTDGFRENNDLKENIFDVFAQMSLSYQTSIQGEFRSVDIDKGDLTLRFFPHDFLSNLRDETRTNSFRMGLRHTFCPGSDLIASAMYQNAESKTSDVTFPMAVKFKTDEDNYSAEVQHLLRLERFSVVAGAGYFHIDRKDLDWIKFLLPPPMATSGTTDSDLNHTNLYLYSNIHYPKNVILTLGASGDFFRGGVVDRDQFNPKLGLTWSPFSGTTLRGAVFRTLKRTLITNQTLEPTQVAGFNQFFDDVDGTEAWRYGIGLDQKFHSTLYGGIEVSGRNLEVPYKYFRPPPSPAVPLIKEADWEEKLGRAYLYWAPHPWLALTAEYQYEELDRDKEFTANTAEQVKTHRIPLGINFYHPSGLNAQLKSTYFHQKGKFQPQGADPAAPSLEGKDQFWIVDAALSYRLPKRYGILSVEAKNLFDKSFKYMDTDPVSPTIQPKRLVLFKFTLSF